MPTSRPNASAIALPAEIAAALPGVRALRINADMRAAIIDSTPRTDVVIPARSAGPHVLLSMILEGEACHIADGVGTPYNFAEGTCVLSCSWDAHCGADYFAAYRRLHAVSLSFRTDWLELFAPLLLPDRAHADVLRHPQRRSYIVRLPMWQHVRDLTHKLLEASSSSAFDALLLERYALTALWEVADRLRGAGPEPGDANAASPRRTLSGRDRRLLVDARGYIDAHYLEPVRVEEIGKAVGLGYSTLKMGFPLLFGKSVYGYVLERRIQHAARLLADTGLSVQEIANRSGFSHSSHMARLFRARFGMSPRGYRSR